MSRTLSITLGSTSLPKSNHFNPDTIPPAKTPAEMAIFFEENSDEIAFARSVLEHAPVGTKLSCHFDDKAIIYHDSATDESCTLQHTYVVISEGILAVQIERGDINIIGVGSYGEVKRVYPLPNQTHAQQAPHAVAIKKFRASSILSSSKEIPDTVTARLGKADKPKNPLKSVTQGEMGTIEKPLWPGSDIHLRFNADDFDTTQKPAKIKPLNPDLDKTREKIQNSSTATKLETAPAWPMSLATFMRMNQKKQTADVVLKIITSFLKAVETIHNKGWIHRDIKPENILTDGELAVPTDFDFATKIPEGADHVVDRFCGTKEYLSYELIEKLPLQIRNAISPQFSLFWPEIPEKYKVIDSQAAYRSSSEMPAIGLTILRLRHTLQFPESDIGNAIKSLSVLMGCYHPEGRPSLMLIRLAFFSLLWNEKQITPGLRKNDPVAVSAALGKEGLPILSIEIIQAIRDVLVLTSEIFQIAQTRSSKAKEHHEKNQWTLLGEINTKLEVLIHDQANLTAFMSLRGMLVLCRNNCCSERLTITYCINLITFLESRLFYQPLLSALNTASPDERKYFLIALSISSRIFQGHPEEQALSLHALNLLRKIPSSIELWQLQEIILKKDLITLFCDLITQHKKEETASTTQQDTHTLSCPRFFQATSHETKMPIGFGAGIEATLQNPSTDIQDKVAQLQAIHVQMTRQTTITEEVSAITAPQMR